MAEQKPYRIGMPRGDNGQFAPKVAAEKDMPDNPLVDIEEGKKAPRWAPRIGMNSRPTFQQRNPYPPIDPRKSVSRPPMKNLTTGRR